MQSSQGPAYHERQRLHQCLRHSLNNLFQSSQFSSGELDAIADTLAPGRLPLPFLHPHRTLLMGNYDVNVLEVALRRHGKELRWYDLRDAAFKRLDLRAAWALVLNVQSHSTLGRLTGGRHWLALRRFDGRWWNLDSNLPAPRPVADCCRSAAEGAPSSPQVAPARGAAAGQAAAAAQDGDDAAGKPAAAAADTAAGGGAATAHSASGADAAAEVGEGRGAAAAAGAGTAAVPDAGADTGGLEAQQAAVAGVVAAAAADEAAVRRFLADQVRRHDAKVFVVLDSPLESHPLQDSPADAAAAADS